MDNPKRILIFELNWLGDILFSFPLLRAIRKKFPEAYISCVVVPRYAGLLMDNPWINDVHVLSDDNSITFLPGKVAFINLIKKEKYDTCIFLKPSKSKGLFASLAGIPRRIGFIGKGVRLTDAVEAPSPELHRADQILSLAGALGITQADGTYEYFFNRHDEQRAQKILHNSGGGIQRMIAINPGGNWDAKRWPAAKYILLTKKILEFSQDIEVMVSGAEKDVAIAKKIVAQVNSHRCYSVAGKTKLNELAALFKKCELVVSADSGPLHLASATGVTTVGLFGPTSSKITGPRGKGKNIIISKPVDCEVPCYVENCGKEYKCMEAISADDVFKIVSQELI